VAAGGRRNGSGRPKGARTKKTQEPALKQHDKGITPLDVMCEVMRDYYAAGERDKAVAIAKDAAPYMHPRLSYVKSDVSHADAELERALEDELVQLSRERAAANGAMSADQGPSAEPPHPRRNGRGPVAGADPP
jgi:hypothetical protein